jgi:hypothetical protein
MANGYISSENNSGATFEKTTRWLMPSIADLVFVALLAVLTCTNLSARLLGDAGIGWHIRTGQLILSTHAVPRADPFSAAMSGQPCFASEWFAWEWLYEVAVGYLDRLAGLNGVVLLTALLIAVTFAWTLRLLLRDTNLAVAIVLILLAASASMIHFQARPHVATWLFTVIWFYILDSNENKLAAHRGLLWLLPVLMIFWVNIHGGFLLGLVLIIIYWVSAIWQSVQAKEDRFENFLTKTRAGKRARNLTIVGALCALATFVNPYGWKLHVHIYGYLSNHFLMDHIDEFQSPNFHGVAQKCFIALLLLTLVAFAVDKGKTGPVRLSDALLALFAVYSGLYAARNIPIASLLLILIIGPRLSRAFQSREQSSAPSASFLQRMNNLDSTLRGHLWPAIAIALTIWIAFHSGSLGSNSLMDAHFDAKRFPVAAVDYLEQHKIHDPLFAPDSWGGYLIYRLYPQTKVILDDRHDFYGEPFLRAYLKTIHVEPGWQDFLTAHQVSCIVVPKSSALANILLETPRWKPIYTDNTAVVFAASSGSKD